METNKNINRNREPLTPEDIEQGRNFDQFMQAYNAQKLPFWKKPGFYIGSAVIGTVIAVGTYMAVAPGEKPASPETAFVKPPLPGIDVRDTAYTVNAAAGDTLTYHTGSLLIIPQNAFLGENGQPVNGAVEIRYREFHDPASIFIAGIPMTYDSAGVQYHFESAGMLEITAWQNGKPLKANPAQPIEVALASQTAVDKFNIYYLDTTARNWSFIKRDTAYLIAGQLTDTAAAKAKTAGPQPIRPQLADTKRPSFSIDFDPLEFPELNAYKGLRFEVDEARTPYNRADRKIQWDDARIARNSDGRTLTVTFTKDTLQRSYITYVVVDNRNYAAAMKEYEARFAAYETALGRKISTQQATQQKLDENVDRADKKRLSANALALCLAAIRSRSNVGSKQENQTMRLFVIQDFGIWNSDCPANLPPAEPLALKLIDGRNKQEITSSKVFLVEKGRNAIFTYSPAMLGAFQCNLEMENILWCITPDGQLATADADALATLKDKKKAELTLSVHQGVLASPEQTKSVLGL
ncbi:MAG: hypothetical protein MUC87_21490 [Bacteroidia bacterium]|jgi:hypothetical protein|nr:hypothetical protein [Bacteroidia bacterium]